jgi:1-acyl-sn-glycerol-3-phosphate acyltransferase
MPDQDDDVGGATSRAYPPEPEADRRPFRRLQRLAEGRTGATVLVVWGFAEAICFPVVPDVLLGVLALVAPRRALPLFACVIVGALAGTAALFALSLAVPDAVRGMLVALPGIRTPMLTDASALVASGDPLSLALFGPGTPLKVYTFAWAVGPATPAALALAAVINRVTRIGPFVVALAIVGRLAPTFIRRHDRLVLAVYALFFVVTYALYWR